MDEVRLPGEWAAVVHRERGELLVHYHSPISRIGKRYLFTRLLKTLGAFKRERVRVGHLPSVVQRS
jgi:hypothetical protein